MGPSGNPAWGVAGFPVELGEEFRHLFFGFSVEDGGLPGKEGFVIQSFFHGIERLPRKFFGFGVGLAVFSACPFGGAVRCR